MWKSILFGPTDERLLKARLKSIVDALPISTALNPVGTLVAFFPFFERMRVFGSLPMDRVLYAVVPQIAVAACAILLFLRNRDGIASLKALERQLVALQFIISVCWGATIWLFWDPASQANHLFVAIISVTIVWNVLFTRLPHTPIFLAGFVPLCAALWARLLTASDEVSQLLSQILPIWFTYILMMGLSGRMRVDAAFRNAFAREDLTEALRASNGEAQRKQHEAEAANAAKTAFLANMSHELRTPLNAILGFSEIISAQALGREAVDRYSEYANDIHTSGAHLLSLINDLLDVAKIDPGPLDAASALRDVARLMSSRAQARGLALDSEVATDLPCALADDRAFRQIVLNLISNAVKFTPAGGRIVVRLRAAAPSGLLLEVEDTGIGIPPEKLKSVFRPFSQIDNRYGRQAGGTGLGLALVKGLSELHGGECWIESVMGVGTKVSVHFPLSGETQVRSAVAAG